MEIEKDRKKTKMKTTFVMHSMSADQMNFPFYFFT